jgi:hypothetical protein
VTERAALARLDPDARASLEALTRTLDRVQIDDLQLHVSRVDEPQHRRAIETAELVAIESDLVDVVAAARRVVMDRIIRLFAAWHAEFWLGPPANRNVGRRPWILMRLDFA